MKKSNVYLNYVYNVSYQILIILLPLITTPCISRVLGAEGVGAYSYTQSITNYFILFGCIGLNIYGQKEIACVQDDKHKRSKIFFELVIIRLFTITVSLITFFIICVQNSRYHMLFLVQSISIIASIFDISWFFQGLEDFKKIVVRNFIVKIIGVLLIFLVVKEKNDLNVYALCLSLTLILGNLTMWFYIPRLVDRVDIKGLNFKKHIKPTIIMFLPQIASSVYTMLDKTMIGAITGSDAEVGYYEQSQKIIKIAMTLVTSLGTVMFPRIANSYANNDKVSIEKHMMNSFRFVFLLGMPIMFGIIGISKGMIPWFFGDGFEKVFPNMVIISPIIVIIGLSTIMGTQYLLSTNRQGQLTISVIIGAVVNILLNILFIPKWLSIGAAIGTVIAESVVTIYQIYILRKEFKFKMILRISLTYVVSSLAMLFVVVIMDMYLKDTMINTILQILVGGMVYVSCLFLQKEVLLLTIIKKIKQRNK